MPTVRRATLANGLRVVTVEMPHVSYVALRIVVGVGSRDDPREKAGIAHFVEHLLFRGTARHPHEAAVRAHLASLGIRFNATTNKEWMTIEATIPRESLHDGLRFFAEMLTTPTLNGLEVERRIVMEEMNSAYDEVDGSLWPIDLLADAWMYPFNSLGIPIIGEPRTVMGISLEDVREYLARSYRAGGMALALAGRCELDAVLPWIEVSFAGVPAGAPVLSRRPPLPQKGAIHWIHLAHSPRAFVRMMFPVSAPTHRHMIATAMMHLLLSTDGVGRVHEVLRSRAGIAYTGSSELMILSDCARETVTAEVKKENMPQMVAAVARTLRDLRSRGPTSEELAAVRLLMLRDLHAIHDIPEHAADEYARNAVVDDVPLDAAIALVQEISAPEIMELARATFRSGHAQIVVAGPRDDDDQRAAWRSFESALGD